MAIGIGSRGLNSRTAGKFTDKRVSGNELRDAKVRCVDAVVLCKIVPERSVNLRFLVLNEDAVPGCIHDFKVDPRTVFDLAHLVTSAALGVDEVLWDACLDNASCRGRQSNRQRRFVPSEALQVLLFSQADECSYQPRQRCPRWKSKRQRAGRCVGFRKCA